MKLPKVGFLIRYESFSTRYFTNGKLYRIKEFLNNNEFITIDNNNNQQSLSTDFVKSFFTWEKKPLKSHLPDFL